MLETGSAVCERIGMETIVYLFSNILHTYAIYIFFSVLLGRSKLKGYLEILSYVTFYLINSLCFLLLDNIFLNLLSNILPLIIITFQYNKSIVYRMFCVFSFCAAGMFTEALAISFLPSDIPLAPLNMVPSTVMLAAVFILKYFFKKRDVSLKSNHIWFIVLIAISTLAIGLIYINDENIRMFDWKNMFLSVILMFINLMNFYMYDRELNSLQVQHTLKVIETANKAYQNQLEVMTESQKKIRFLKHDMQNHLYAVKTLVLEKNYEKTLSYIEEMSQSLHIDNEYVSTGNKDVDCLLNFKLSAAKEMGTDFSCDISLPDELLISSFDMTTILGNLLDNSLNALKNTDNKILDIKIRYNKGTVQIDIENTYSPTVKTEKKDKGEHGLGLMSVAQTLKKYHGIMSTYASNERFHVNVFLYNSFE